MSELPAELAEAGDDPEMGVSAFHALRESGAAFQLLDIRDDWERAIGSLAGSIDIPMSALPDSLDRLSPDGAVVVLCHHGMRSYQAALWLRDEGFENAFSVAGGIDAWSIEVDPSVARY